MASPRFVGIDVSKSKVDVHWRPGGVVGQFPRDPKGLREMVKALKKEPIKRIVVEATGGYERTVLKALVGEGLPVVLIQPRRARAFATATRRHAKTDPIDAEVLAMMAELATQDDVLWTQPSVELEELRGLVRRRQQLIAMAATEKTRARQVSTEGERKSVDRLRTVLAAELAQVDAEIDASIKANKDFRLRVAALKAVCGVGRVTAFTLLVELPELGTLDRSSVVALAGLAPMAKDSGQRHGNRFIVGGRGTIRTVLYMGVLSALRRPGPISAFYKRLVAKGKPAKVAITACMRKLLTHLNALLREALKSAVPVAEAAGGSNLGRL